MDEAEEEEMTTRSEVDFELSPGGCWVPELKMRCPFVEAGRAGRAPRCMFFDTHLQTVSKLEGQKVRRCLDCKKWKGRLTITLMPA